MMKHNFEELIVWKRIRIFIVDIYKLTKQYPAEEKYDLVSQMRRASVSSSLKIIEGIGRATDKQLANFLDISYGSMKEVQGCLIHSFDLEYISQQELEKFEIETIELQKMIYSFRHLNNSTTKQLNNQTTQHPNNSTSKQLNY